MQFKKIKKEDTYDLRRKVLRKGIDLPYVFEGDDLSDALHYAVEKDGKYIAVVSFVPFPFKMDSSNEIQLRGMAVDPEYQGMGVGNFLVKQSELALKNLAYDFVWCNARKSAYDFYLKLGFERRNDEFVVDQIGIHDRMFKTI
ncbi:MAG: GNAT family N-acetyltransferase [Flavobacteriaceae bacterium]